MRRLSPSAVVALIFFIHVHVRATTHTLMYKYIIYPWIYALTVSGMRGVDEAYLSARIGAEDGAAGEVLEIRPVKSKK